jgi:hypothetical protein
VAALAERKKSLKSQMSDGMTRTAAMPATVRTAARISTGKPTPATQGQAKNYLL